MTQAIRAAAVILLGAIFIAGPAFAQSDAASLYKTKCQMCHGANGNPAPTGVKMGARSFQSPEVVKESDSMLFTITKSGKNKMPAYKSLTDEQIKGLVKYMRSLK
jgi:mono/diheme cytochrome c family protein